MTDRLQNSRRIVAIVRIDAMREDKQHQPEGVGDDLAPASFDLSPASWPEAPPASVVLTLWLSMTLAAGPGLPPSSSRVATTIG